MFGYVKACALALIAAPLADKCEPSVLAGAIRRICQAGSTQYLYNQPKVGWRMFPIGRDLGILPAR